VGAMAHPYFDVPRPTILGHRGAAGDAPENTLRALERALADGAHVIESDVQCTRDGVPVLIHDPSVDRTTEARGAVADLDWKALRELDAGYHFQPEGESGFSERGRGVHIPSLEEAFKAFPAARFNLEIKSPDPAATERTLHWIRALDREDRTLLTAGEDGVMARLREALVAGGLHPALGAGLADILDVVRSAVDGKPPSTDSQAIQVPTAFGGRPLVTPELVAHAHAHGIAVHVWTINERAEIERLLGLGCDGIVTDHPGRMAAWVADR